MLSVSLDFLLPALLGGGCVGGGGLVAGPPGAVVEAEGPAGDLGLARVGPPLRRYCSSTVWGAKYFSPAHCPAVGKYFTNLRNFLLCREASRGPTDTVRRAGLACQVMLYLWCKLSSNLGLGVEPVLHHGLLVYDPNLGWDQLCGVARPRCFTVLLSQT